MWWLFALLYLEHTVVLLKSPQDHIDQISTVLRVLHKAADKVKFKKHKIGAKTIDYLGNNMRPDRLALRSAP